MGRPRDPVTDHLICPKCNNKELRKGGFHVARTRAGTKKQQMFVCRLCNFHTTKPRRGDA